MPFSSEVSKRGWRMEGVGTRKSFPCHASFFLSPPPYEQGDTILATFFCTNFFGPCQPPSPYRQLTPFSRKGFCRNPTGIFPNRVQGEFCGFFFGDFFGLFPWNKKEEKSTKKSTAKFKSEFGIAKPSNRVSSTYHDAELPRRLFMNKCLG